MMRLNEPGERAAVHLIHEGRGCLIISRASSYHIVFKFSSVSETAQNNCISRSIVQFEKQLFLILLKTRVILRVTMAVTIGCLLIQNEDSAK
jgi:hypothetical protein